jgi:hypothetical protein
MRKRKPHRHVNHVALVQNGLKDLSELNVQNEFNAIIR